MGRILGRGRYVYGTYPSPPNASAIALQNRNVAEVTSLGSPFIPATSPNSVLIAAILFTPRVSGVVQVTALLTLANGAAPETYAMAVQIATGTGLSVTGGEVTSNGWVIGSLVPPVIGGAGIAIVQGLGSVAQAVAASGSGDLAIASAISQPLPVGVPFIIEVVLTELGGGNSIDQLAFTSLSVIELP